MNDDEAIDAARALDVLGGVLGSAPGGSLLVAVFDQWSSVQRTRARSMVVQLLRMLAEDESAVIRRVQRDARLLRLVGSAAQAAAVSESTAKISLLAAMTAQGIVDDATVDASAYLVDVLAQLEPIDLRLLLALESLEGDQEAGLETAHVLGVGPGVAQLINAKALRLAVAQSTGASFTGLYDKLRPSELGTEILAMLRRYDSAKEFQQQRL